MAKKKRLILRVQHRRLNGRGFGCYFEGSVTRGEARIVVDCDALAWSEAEASGRIAFKRGFIDTLAHEFVHALEESFGLMFNEKAVHASIAAARKQKRTNAEAQTRATAQGMASSPLGTPAAAPASPTDDVSRSGETANVAGTRGAGVDAAGRCGGGQVKEIVSVNISPANARWNHLALEEAQRQLAVGLPPSPDPQD